MFCPSRPKYVHSSALILVTFNFMDPDKLKWGYRCSYFLIYQSKQVLCAQKNHLTEMVLLSTYNIWFGCEIRIIRINLQKKGVKL